MSVCPIYLPLQQRAAGLLLGASRAADTDRQRRAPGSTALHVLQRSAGNASSVTFTAAVEG